jgi:hypothetical protein
MPNLNIKNIKERNDDDQSQKSHNNSSVFQTYTYNPVIEKDKQSLKTNQPNFFEKPSKLGFHSP